MCFHNSMSKKAQQLAARYGRNINLSAVEIAEQILEENYHITGFFHPEQLIVTSEKELQEIRWGLIPFWAKDKKTADKISKGTVNARAETIFEKPSYRNPIMHHRCLIPSTGYYEWHENKDGTKVPYYIYLKDQEIFSFAGIYSSWLNPDTGKEEMTFSMITTDANELTKKIHNSGKNPFRMPVIISMKDEEKWLDPKLTREQIDALLKPYPADEMDAYEVNKEVFESYNPKDEAVMGKE